MSPAAVPRPVRRSFSAGRSPSREPRRVLEPPFIAGVSADGAHFVDQYGAPRLLVSDNVWGIVPNGGKLTAGDYQSTYDTYLASRAAQGYTAAKATVFSCPIPNDDWGTGDGNSQDWDGAEPFTTAEDPSSGMNETFWARRDYFISAARLRHMTAILNVTTPSLDASPTPAFCRNWTQQQWTDYGTALGNRYRNMPNVLWELGDDYFGGIDTNLAAFITALRAAGDAHALCIFNFAESTSRLSLFDGVKDPNSIDVWSEYEHIYTYNVSYVGLEQAQLYVPTASDHVQHVIPPIWGDGHYLASGVGAGQTDVRLMRQMIWWALTSGACGISIGDNEIYPWVSASPGLVTSKTFYSAVMPAIVSAFSGLTGWQRLFPDTSSVLVTAGRGTHASPIQNGQLYTANTDDYVAASRTPDTGSGSSLAAIYCGKAFNITIDQSKMVAGYTATWVDPLTGATQAGTPGSVYNSATAVGNNSAGDPDWVLVLRGP